MIIISIGVSIIVISIITRSTAQGGGGSFRKETL